MGGELGAIRDRFCSVGMRFRGKLVCAVVRGREVGKEDGRKVGSEVGECEFEAEFVGECA